ncbi:hypothetical protein GGF46_002901 [Coemansia sp. RSA 552]|nr:hypothetical protein GGF46_002901 [Coemansia sp. RSA 552]
MRGAELLPDEVLFSVFACCNGDDVRAFSEANDHLWKVLLAKRVGHIPAGTEQTYRELYDEQDRLALGIADQCEIARNRLPYWDSHADPRALFGRVASLIAVDWLHVAGTLRGVHMGRYRVIWRLSILPRASNIFGIEFSAKASGDRRTASQLPYDASVLDFGSDFFDFALPLPLEITAPFEDVLLECKSISNEWKSSMAFCSVRLEPIDSRPYTQRYIRNGCRSILYRADVIRTQHRRRGSAAPTKGPRYRPWQPWKLHNTCETASMAVFGAIVCILFAYLLVSKTR